METKARSQRRQRESKGQHGKIEAVEERGRTGSEALSLTHLQGAFVILVLGVLLAAVTIVLETLLTSLSNRPYSLGLSNH